MCYYSIAELLKFIPRLFLRSCFPYFSIIEPIEFIAQPLGLGLGAMPKQVEPPKKKNSSKIRIKKQGEEERKVCVDVCLCVYVCASVCVDVCMQCVHACVSRPQCFID